MELERPGLLTQTISVCGFLVWRSIVLAAIGKVHQGCVQVGWTETSSPVTDDLREHMRTYRDDGDVRQPRFGYIPEDAERILVYLKEHGSKFALPAEIALRCGLRVSEIAGLQGRHVDLQKMILHVTCKGGIFCAALWACFRTG
jgi:integrase